jgi:hypothetical protein
MLLPDDAGEVRLGDPVVDEPDLTPAGQLFESDRNIENLDNKDPCPNAVETATRKAAEQCLAGYRPISYGRNPPLAHRQTVSIGNSPTLTIDQPWLGPTQETLTGRESECQSNSPELVCDL